MCERVGPSVSRETAPLVCEKIVKTPWLIGAGKMFCGDGGGGYSQPRPDGQKAKLGYPPSLLIA